MKISKFTAPDMRQALRAVRNALGPDAVILASHKTATGIEITAAVDYDGTPVYRIPAPPATTFQPEEFDKPAAPPPAPAAATEETLSDELKRLRRILETQVAQLAWNDLTRRAPIHTEILRELAELGFASDFAAQIVSRLPSLPDLGSAHRHALTLIAGQIPVKNERWLNKGGCVALIGPTGAGKSTTMAKLAARWVLRHGPRSLALVSCDSVRIGAHDPVRALGQMLGAPVACAEDFLQLPPLLERLKDRRMILIDTPGLSQRHPQLDARLSELIAAGGAVQTLLVLAASTQAGAIGEIVARFARARPAACVLTKLDEAASLGGALSVLVRHRMPVAFVSEGPRVPEDLRPARAFDLIAAAVRLARSSGAAADEDLLCRRYGELAHALA